MTSIKSQREPMSPADQAQLERRICRRYKDGVPFDELTRTYRMSADEIEDMIRDKFPDTRMRERKLGKPLKVKSRRAS